jgi:hypothetical protein
MFGKITRSVAGRCILYSQNVVQTGFGGRISGLFVALLRNITLMMWDECLVTCSLTYWFTREYIFGLVVFGKNELSLQQ